MSPSIFSILQSLIMESCDITEASLKLLRIIHSNNGYGDYNVSHIYDASCQFRIGSSFDWKSNDNAKNI